MSLLETLYNISIPEDQFEEIALLGWDLIGNKRMRIYRYQTEVDQNGNVELPCNTDTIEAVTTNWEEWNNVTNNSPEGDLNSAFTESYIEHRKQFKHPLYANGKFLKYERIGNTLHFEQCYGPINIVYRGVVLDDSGLPTLTDKEASALATYCAYIIKFKEGISTNNGALIQMAEVLRQQWLIKADQARVGYYMSQNEWDEILDARTNWNRKQFNKSLKLYK